MPQLLSETEMRALCEGEEISFLTHIVTLLDENAQNPMIPFLIGARTQALTQKQTDREGK